MLCGLIMAGGRGERFWPLSTEDRPKQFLSLLGEDTMIQMTVKRLNRIIPMNRIFVVTGKKYVTLVQEQLPMLPARNIIVEPMGKNTAPCIGLSSFVIERYFKDSTLVVVPSDHLIKDEEGFAETILAGEKHIEKNRASVITLGIKPDRPETGYGYIKSCKDVEECLGFNVKRVDSFVEKPDCKRALEYLRDGNYLWNSGMFIWRTGRIKELIMEHLTNMYTSLEKIDSYFGSSDYDKVLEYEYSKIDGISVDYGIMERAKEIYVIPSDFGWDDVGSWWSLERYRKKDYNNNVGSGEISFIDSKGNIVIGDNIKIALIGMEDTLIVNNGDLILIGKKNYIDKIKNIKNTISFRGFDEAKKV